MIHCIRTYGKSLPHASQEGTRQLRVVASEAIGKRGLCYMQAQGSLISKSLQGRSRGSTRGVEEGPGVRRRGPGTISEQIATRNLVDAGSFDDS